MADNTYKTEYGTLASLFSTGWESMSAVQYENMAYKPTIGTKWARFSVTNGEADYVTIGTPTSNRVRHAGVIMVQCFAPQHMGAMIAKEMADKAISIFRGANKDGYTFRAGYSVVIPAGEVDTWFQVNAVIPFYRDAIGYTEPTIETEENMEV